jgi:cation:H+ antiporter
MTYLMVAGGLILLLVGGDVLVRGAVSLAQCIGVSPLVIGLTVVAFGTSAPELVVCVNAALSGAPEMAIGNVVGSNIANILLVLGLPAAIFPITCGAGTIRRDTILMLLVSCAFVVAAWFGSFQLWQGLIMVASLLGFLFWSYLSTRASNDRAREELVDEIEGISARPHGIRLALGFIAAGLVGLIAGSHLLVEGALAVALAAGVSEAVIGLTLLALGTSLPELATSLIATIRRHGDVAVGNVVGSNLFNLLGIMGVTAIVHPVPVPLEFLRFDLWVMLAAALLLVGFAADGRTINRITGSFLAVAYGAYIWALFNGLTGVGLAASL